MDLKGFIFILAFSAKETLPIFLLVTQLPITVFKHMQFSGEDSKLKCHCKLESSNILFREQK